MPPKKMEKYNHVMIDLETLDTLPHAVILSIGAVKFNEKNIDDSAFYRVVTIQSNLDEHRTISPSTLRWWLDQDAKAKAVFDHKEQVSLEDALNELRDWGGSPLDWEHMKVWGNGSDFDCAMLAHAYGLAGTPWKFYNTRCFRTIKSMEAAKNVPKPANPTAHNALSDAIAQAKHLQAIWAAGIGK